MCVYVDRYLLADLEALSGPGVVLGSLDSVGFTDGDDERLLNVHFI